MNAVQDGWDAPQAELVLIADDAAGRLAVQGIAAATERSAADPITVATAARTLATWSPATAAVLLDAGADVDGLDALLPLLSDAARTRGVPVLIITTRQAIDSLGTAAIDPMLTVLADPREGEAEGLLAALLRRTQRVPSAHAPNGSDDLAAVAAQARALADALGALNTGAGPALPAVGSDTSEPGGEGEADPAMIRALLKARRLRDSFFPPALFGEPAWDMLLDLALARIEGKRVAVSSLCIAAAVPATTALRWIAALCEEKLFERHADPADRRRVFIALSDKAATGMARYLAAVRRSGAIG